MTTVIKDKSTPIGLTAEPVQENTITSEIPDIIPAAEEATSEASEEKED